MIPQEYVAYKVEVESLMDGLGSIEVKDYITTMVRAGVLNRVIAARSENFLMFIRIFRLQKLYTLCLMVWFHTQIVKVADEIYRHRADFDRLELGIHAYIEGLEA